MSNSETINRKKGFSPAVAWLAVTVGVFVVVLALEAWTTTFPYDASHCLSAPVFGPVNSLTVGLLVVLFLSGVVGIVAAGGWRLWFVATMVAVFISQVWFIGHQWAALPRGCG